MSERTTLGFFRLPPELPSLSMDLYADHAAAAVAAAGDAFAVTQVRPPRTPLSRLLERGAGAHGFAYWRRFPSYLWFARSTRFDLNHVLDHAYAHLTFALPPERTIVTCHDIYPLKRRLGEIPGVPPQPLPPLTLRASLAGLRRAAAVVTPTASTRDDLVRLVGIDAQRIAVVSYGLNRVFRPFPPEERAAARAALPAPHDAVRLLAVDTGSAYKNHGAIAHALAAALAEGRRCVLLHAGDAGAMLAAAAERGVADAVVALGRRSAAELAAVYNGCDVLLFPSAYEGFGWPPLEAMACGIPVAASTAPAVAEVVGDCALRVDPTDNDAFATAVRRLLDDGELRSRLVDCGLARAATFTWGLAGERLSAIYDKVLRALV